MSTLRELLRAGYDVRMHSLFRDVLAVTLTKVVDGQVYNITCANRAALPEDFWALDLDRARCQLEAEIVSLRAAADGQS